MRNRPALVTPALLLALAACDRSSTTTGTGSASSASTASTATSTATASAPATATAIADASTTTTHVGPQDGGPHGVGDKTGAALATFCPTAAPGASVSIEDSPNGVTIAVTAKSEAETKEIRERAKRLVEADRTEGDAGVRHDGHGSAGGRYGRCIVVMKDTQLESKEIPGGVRLTVKAKNAAEVGWLRKETREREREAKKDGG